MKKLILVFSALCVAVCLHAAVSKTVNLTIAGTLSTVLTTTELSTITDLTITGNVDARDFKTMRDKMSLLSIIDLSGATIFAYIGTEGTGSTSSMTYAANEVPYNAFFDLGTYIGKTSLTSLKLPTDVTAIGDNALQRSSLTTVSIPPLVTTIGFGVYYRCTELSAITIPSTVKIIGEKSFSYCTNAATISIPASVTNIGASAFWNCTGFKSLIIPSSVTSIGSNAFDGCTGLKSISVLHTTPLDISKSSSVFANIDKSTCTLYVPAGTKTLYAAASQWKDFTNIQEYSDMALTLSSSSENISSSAVTRTVAISSNAAWAASCNASWISLSPVSGLGNATLSITASANTGIAREAIVTVTNGSVSKTISISQDAIANALFITVSSNIKTMVAAAGIVSVDVSANVAWTATSNQAWLTLSPASGRSNSTMLLSAAANTGAARTATITIVGTGATTKTITVQQDAGTVAPVIVLSKLAASLPSSASSTSFDITANCAWTLTSSSSWLSLNQTSGTNNGTITVSASVNIGASRTGSVSVFVAGETATIYEITITQVAGGSTSPIKSVNVATAGTLASALTSNELDAITELHVSGTIDARDFKTMRDKMPLLSVVDLSAATIVAYTGTGGTSNIANASYAANEVPFCAFFLLNLSIGKPSLSSLTLPQSVTSVDSSAFQRSGLLRVELPAGVKTIDYGVYYRCSTLVAINIPSTVTTLGEKSFSYSINASTINIPSSVTSIGASAFWNCSGAKSVSIPSSVTTIGANAFDGCTGLTSITVQRDIPLDLSASSSVFAYVNKSSCILYVPAGTKALYAAANQWKDFTNIAEVDVTLSAMASTNSLEANASTASITVSSNTAWIASSDQTWLTVSPASGSNNGTVSLTAIANTGATRSATVTVTGTGVDSKFITITQAAATTQSSLTLSTSTASILSSAGTATATVTSNIAWTASSNQTWLSVSPASGSNNGTITLTATANTGAARTATVTVSGTGVTAQTITVTQAAATTQSSLTLSISTASMLSSAGTATATVTSNVAWTASSNQTWLSVSPASGSNNGTITLTATANTGAARTATVTVSGTGVTAQTITVTQAAATTQSSLTLSTSTASMLSSAGITTATVTSNIAWTASSNQTWLSVSPASGSNNGTITLTATANTGAARTATVTVSGTGVTAKTITVTQAAATTQSSLTLSTSTASMLSSTGTATATVTSNIAWTATSNQTWLTVNPASGSNNGTITLTATANTGAARNATVTVSGTGVTAQTITVTQAAGNGTSVDANAANTFVVYPNPTTESIAVNSDELVEVSVYSGSHYLFSQTVVGKQSISLAELPAGEYVVVVKTAKGVSSHTVVKQ